MAQQDEETDIEFDENDNKIIQLYEVINELIDDQKAKTEDLELLYQDKDEIVLRNVEIRNNSVLDQIWTQLQLKEKNEDDEEDEDEDSDTDSDEDEQDQGWEIYHTVHSNLNQYMLQIALFSKKLNEQREQIEKMEVSPMAEEEVKELENCVEAQTAALEAQMKRNEDLEKALSSVLNEYSNRITIGNEEIASLHQQLSSTNKQHSKQIEEMRKMYEKKINQLQKTQNNQYQKEVNALIDTLSTSRGQFQEKILSLTEEMNNAQTAHHREMIKMTQYNQTLTESLAQKTIMVEDLKKEKFESQKKGKKINLIRERGELDIDDEEEFFYVSSATQTKMNMDKQAKRTRSFKPEQYGDTNGGNNNMESLSQGRSRNVNNINTNYTSKVSNGSSNSKLQKMYQRAQKKKDHGQRNRYTHKNGY